MVGEEKNQAIKDRDQEEGAPEEIGRGGDEPPLIQWESESSRQFFKPGSIWIPAQRTAGMTLRVSDVF